MVTKREIFTRPIRHGKRKLSVFTLFMFLFNSFPFSPVHQGNAGDAKAAAVPTGDLHQLIRNRLNPSHTSPRPVSSQAPFLQPVSSSYRLIPLAQGEAVNPDLFPTPDVQITEDIAALAEQLGHDIEAIFDFVHDKIAFEPYFGSLKGSQRTLLEHAGNDFDSASLLIALLRASGIPARYATGTMTIPMNKVRGWLRLKDKETAFRLLSFSMPSGAVRNRGGKLTGAEVVRVWARAFLATENRWVDLDPSFKKHRQKKPKKLDKIGRLDPDESFAEAIRTAEIDDELRGIRTIDEAVITSSLEAASSRLGDFLDRKRRKKEVTAETLFGGSSVRPTRKFFPFEAQDVVDGPELSNTVRYQVRVLLPGIDHTILLPALAGARITISYAPVTPALKVGGEKVAEGLPGTEGALQTLVLEVTHPAGAVFPLVHSLLVGGYYATVLDLQTVREDVIATRRAAYQEALARLNAGESVPRDDVIGELLTLKGLAYFHEVDAQIIALARQMGIRFARLTFAEGLVGFDQRGTFIDVRSSGTPFSERGDVEKEKAFSLTAGMMSSVSEGNLFETFYGVSSTSTIKVLNTANQLGIEIYEIGPDNIESVLPILDYGPQLTGFITDVIREDVESRGLHVIIPATRVAVGQWLGVGFIEVDPSTGQSSFIIVGGIVAGELIFGGAAGETKPDLPGFPNKDVDWSEVQDLAVNTSVEFVDQATLSVPASTTLGVAGFIIDTAPKVLEVALDTSLPLADRVEQGALGVSIGATAVAASGILAMSIAAFGAGLLGAPALPLLATVAISVGVAWAVGKVADNVWQQIREGTP